jgi:hypothetical protein
LVKHLIRVFLRTRINQYLIELPLPSTIDLFEGFSIVDMKMVVCNDYLIAYGKGKVNPLSEPRFKPASQELRITHHADHSMTFESEDEQELVARGSATMDPAENDFYRAKATKGGFLQLWISRGLFQAAADKYLNIDQSDAGSDSSGSIYWTWSWWMRLRNQGVNFIDMNKIRIGLDFKGGGDATAGIKTHCGPIGLKTALKASLVPTPTLLDLQLLLDSNRRKVKIHADAKPGGVKVEPEHWWDVLGWVLALILTIVGTGIWNLIVIALDLITIDVANLPERFPGTDLEYSTFGFNTSFWGAEHYLITLGVDFK